MLDAFSYLCDLLNIVAVMKITYIFYVGNSARYHYKWRHSFVAVVQSRFHILVGHLAISVAMIGFVKPCMKTDNYSKMRRNP
jgi:hypothetical protein